MRTNLKLELFLFFLARDHLPLGTINDIILQAKQIDSDNVRNEVEYLEDAQFIGSWAKAKATDLKS